MNTTCFMCRHNPQLLWYKCWSINNSSLSPLNPQIYMRSKPLHPLYSSDINLIFSIVSPYICPEYLFQLPLAKIWPMAGFGLVMMMLMRKKHYGFRSGNDIKAGGFCTGTNDQEKQEAWDPILPLDEEGNDDFDNSKWKGISSHYIPYHHFCPLFYVLSFYACILSLCNDRCS